MRSVVVFPQPEGPRSAKKLPRGTSSVRASTATTSSKRFVTRSRRTSGADVSPPAVADGSTRSSTAIGSVDLRHHMLDLRVVLERVDREILAVARLLVAAVRHLGDERDVVVYPDGAELELARRVQRPPNVARPHRGGEAVADVVGPGYRLVVVRELLDAHDRPEDLTLDDLVVLLDPGD